MSLTLVVQCHYILLAQEGNSNSVSEPKVIFSGRYMSVPHVKHNGYK